MTLEATIKTTDHNTPVTIDWLNAINCTYGDMSFGAVQLMEDRTFRLSINGVVANRTATRGDVRDLVRIMGYEVKKI